MSISLQKYLKERRQYGCSSYDTSARAKIYSDRYLMSQMTLERELEGHGGCVNTLDWSLSGDKLLSGSDDTKLNIYYPFEDYRLANSINTGHRANIFSAKFMPKTSDNIIISAAGDSEVRLFDLNNAENPLFAMYICHSDQVKKICTYDDNPNEFLTCSQDGTVRHFDIRVPHICTPHNVRTFLTASSRPAKQDPIPTYGEREIHLGCSKPIIDYSRFFLEMNCLAVNNTHTQYFAVAGMNDFIYLHDRRMVNSTSNSSFCGSKRKKERMDDAATTTCCVMRFSPNNDGYDRMNQHITSCKFSKHNGQELIGSWSSDAVYLFNIHDSSSYYSPFTVTPYSLSCDTFPKHTVGDQANRGESIIERTGLTLKLKRLWKKTVKSFWSSTDTTNAERYNLKFASQTERGISFSSITLSMTELLLGKSCGHILDAFIFANKIFTSRKWYSSTHDDTTIDDFTEQEFTSLEAKIKTAKECLAKIQQSYCWQGEWNLAVGYWLIAGGNHHNKCPKRSYFLEKALVCIRLAKKQFHILQLLIESQQQKDHTSSSQGAETTSLPSSLEAQLDPIHLELINKFAFHLEHAYNETTMPDDGPSPNFSNIRKRWKMLFYLHISLRGKKNLLHKMPTFDYDESRSDYSGSSNMSSVSWSTTSSSSDGDSWTINSRSLSDVNINSSSRSSGSSRSGSSSEDEEPGSLTHSPSGTPQPLEEEDDDDSVNNEREETMDVDTEQNQGNSSDSSSLIGIAIYSQIMSDQIMNFYGGRDNSSNEENDNGDNRSEGSHTEHSFSVEGLPVHRDSQGQGYANDVGVVTPRMKYTGHCNTETVKDVDFYGTNDEYIVSGSDSGHLFIWDKKTGRIVQILQADNHIVNVASGHPYLPVLAVSGIDSTVKIFSSKSRLRLASKWKAPTDPNSYSVSSRLYDQNDIVASNLESSRSAHNDIYITRNMIATISRIGRRSRLFNATSDNSAGDSNSEEEEDGS